ncbi:ComEC/Rec2 family competence protein [Psychromonas arctica]|uniref:ComEC/Rec2 family competence protein n=1 Tax=Psychromonas arctica TaxID=168275 RepID=UPI0003F5F8A5|nr:MBL fold metallo-hydrolase [Psychromonas arctica]
MEVSLFGPGVGECVLVKLPNDKWIIVDSFIDKESGKPIALQYLKEQNLNPEEVVELIIVTHWHSDHIAGMSEVIFNCTNASVVIPSAFTKKEFTIFITSLAKDQSLGELNSAKEMKRVMFGLGEHYRNNKIPPIYASEGKCLYRDDVNHINVVALSPSSHSETNSLMELNDLYNKFKVQNPRVHILKQAPNNNSIALAITVKDVSILLGGDLEEPKYNPDKLYGWSAILKSKQVSKRKSVLFKVPHHGSRTGHHDEVWSEMLQKPCSILTTYNSSSLPRSEDIERIKGESNSVYITSPPKIPKKLLRDKRLQKDIDNFCKNLKPKESVTGHVKALVDTMSGSVEVAESKRSMVEL